jgi:hypothetical protein
MLLGRDKAFCLSKLFKDEIRSTAEMGNIKLRLILFCFGQLYVLLAVKGNPIAFCGAEN